MEWLTVKQVAERLGMATKTIRAWRKAGKFPNAKKLGDKNWGIPLSDIESLEKGDVRDTTGTNRLQELKDKKEAIMLEREIEQLEAELADIELAEKLTEELGMTIPKYQESQIALHQEKVRVWEKEQAIIEREAEAANLVTQANTDRDKAIASLNTERANVAAFRGKAEPYLQAVYKRENEIRQALDGFYHEGENCFSSDQRTWLKKVFNTIRELLDVPFPK